MIENRKQYIFGVLILMLSSNFVMASEVSWHEAVTPKVTVAEPVGFFRKGWNAVGDAFARGSALQDEELTAARAAAENKAAEKAAKNSQANQDSVHLDNQNVVNGQLKDQDGFPKSIVPEAQDANLTFQPEPAVSPKSTQPASPGMFQQFTTAAGNLAGQAAHSVVGAVVGKHTTKNLTETLNTVGDIANTAKETLDNVHHIVASASPVVAALSPILIDLMNAAPVVSINDVIKTLHQYQLLTQEQVDAINLLLGSHKKEEARALLQADQSANAQTNNLPLSLEQKLDNYVKAARQASLGVEQNRVGSVNKTITRSLLKPISDLMDAKGVKPLRNSLFSFDQHDQKTISAKEAFTQKADQSAVEQRLNFHANKVMADDEKTEINKHKLGSADPAELVALPPTSAESMGAEENLKAALNVSREIENNRVKTVNNEIKGNTKLLSKALERFHKTKLFRNARVKLGLLDKNDPSISFLEGVHKDKADISSVHNGLNHSIKWAEKPKPVEKQKLPKEIQDAHDKSATAQNLAANQDQVIEQDRVNRANPGNGTWTSYLGDAGQILDIANAAVKGKFFRNTRAKLFGYNPDDQSVSFLEAYRGRRDDMAVRNRALHQADIASNEANEQFHEKLKTAQATKSAQAAQATQAAQAASN